MRIPKWTNEFLPHSLRHHCGLFVCLLFFFCGKMDDISGSYMRIASNWVKCKEGLTSTSFVVTVPQKFTKRSSKIRNQPMRDNCRRRGFRLKMHTSGKPFCTHFTKQGITINEEDKNSDGKKTRIFSQFATKKKKRDGHLKSPFYDQHVAVARRVNGGRVIPNWNRCQSNGRRRELWTQWRHHKYIYKHIMCACVFFFCFIAPWQFAYVKWPKAAVLVALGGGNCRRLQWKLSMSSAKCTLCCKVAYFMHPI